MAERVGSEATSDLGTAVVATAAHGDLTRRMRDGRSWVGETMQNSLSDLPRVQEALREIEGVVHARVAWPDPRGPAQLEIVLSPGQQGAETTRHILDVLERVGGVDLDTLDLAAAERSGAASEARPVFVALSVDRNELDTAIEVILELHGRQVSGRAEGLASFQQSTKTTAAATLAALRKLLPSGVRLQLEWLEVIESHGHRPPIIQVAVTVLTHAGEALHIGSAFAQGDLRESTVRATLDAVNRRLGSLMSSS